jgi:hypothetical protein
VNPRFLIVNQNILKFYKFHFTQAHHIPIAFSANKKDENMMAEQGIMAYMALLHGFSYKAQK